MRPLDLLAAAGRHGPMLLCVGVLIGLGLPGLAALLRPLMGLAVFVFTLGAFLKVDGPAFRREMEAPRGVLAAAFACNVALQLAGAGLFAWAGTQRAFTVGLVSGSRNVTLMWAAAAPFLADRPEVELFIAMAVFPIFMLPVATKRLLAAVADRRARRGAGATLRS